MFNKLIRILKRCGNAFIAWFDSDATLGGKHANGSFLKWLRTTPFILIHLGCFAVIFVGFSWQAIAVAVFLYAFRVFALTGFYHRYFSHRSYKASRFWQFIFAICGMTAAQRGPLWWAAHHRHHHLHSDTELDAHSPRRDGFWRSHMGWFTDMQYYRTEYSRIGDFAKFPELVFLNRFDALVPILLMVGLYFMGEAIIPNGGGMQFLVWGGCISTVAVYHVTFFINSLCHILGKQRFESHDDSRNNLWLALLTFGEGWHNNHHRYPASARQGFYWWEIDITYYILSFMEKIGIIYDMRKVPENILQEGKQLDQQHSS